MLITSAVKKKWFSKPVLPFRRYLGLYEEAFEMGVAIGYAHRDNLTGLVQLFSQAGREEELTIALCGMVQQHLSELPNAAGLLDLGMFREEERCKATVRTQLMLQTGANPSVEDWDKWADRNDIPLNTAFGNIGTVMSLGIALGGAFPQTAEQLWKASYDRTGKEHDISALRAAGLKLPAVMPDPISLAEYGEQMRVVVDAFVAENRPDVITPEQRQDNPGRIDAQPPPLTYADLKARHAAAKANK